MKCKILILILFMAFHTKALGQVIIKITNLPENTPKGAKIFMASSLNNWNPGASRFELKKDDAGYYSISFSESQIPKNENIEYKFTQGNWDTVEGDADGNQIPNRKLSLEGTNALIENQILSWQKKAKKKNTASKNVTVLNQNFVVPQLNTTRRIWIYLPPDYQSTKKRFPVIYMEDGQNLFDDSTSFSGEWKVDETLDKIFTEDQPEAIIIGIDNGGAERLNEYSPWNNKKYGGGKGSQYAEFIVKTLKPYIDKTYRTLPQPKNTGLMGSSMGGLISFYTGMKYPEKFGKLGIFSPSFWFAKNDLKTFINKNSSKIRTTKFYFLAGKNESEEMVSDIQEITELLQSKGVPEQNIITKFDEDGTHSETYWAREFESAYLWLFGK